MASVALSVFSSARTSLKRSRCDAFGMDSNDESHGRQTKWHIQDKHVMSSNALQQAKTQSMSMY